MKVEKPWGFEVHWAKTDKYVGKILFIKAGEQLSLQHHKVKEETIRISSGEMILNIGKTPEEARSNSVKMTEGDVYHIEPGLVHRMTALEDTYVLEVSTPELDDVVRHEDAYGRAD